MAKARRKEKRLGPALMVAFALAAMPRGAAALTVDGSIMTNTALATFSGMAGIGTGYMVSYLATDRVLICNPVVAYKKTATPTLIFPTGTVVFSLCVVNNSITTSALNMVLSDKLPDNMTFVAQSLWTAPAPIAAYSASMAGPWTTGTPVVGQGNPLYLRWTFGLIGPRSSGCVDYQAVVL